MTRIGIYGGSFNPIHRAHLRFAAEARERLRLDRLDLVVSAVPPHKRGGALLPFDLRADLARAAASELPFVRVNTAEGERPGPSYTFDTLSAYRAAEPEAELFFLLGANDLLTLPDWHLGMRLIEQAHLAVAPREEVEEDSVRAFVRAHWPEAQPLRELLPGVAAGWLCPQGHAVYYLPMPWMPVSASMVRAAWRDGQPLDDLVPEPVQRLLGSETNRVEAAWRSEG